MCGIRTAILAALLTGLPSGGARANDIPPAMTFIVAHLDVTSFPSSLGPRRATGKTTFADYGFFPTVSSADHAVLETEDHDWRFEIRLLGLGPGDIEICLHDRAMNGGTYDAQRVLRLRRAGRRLVSDRRTHRDPRCPDFAR